VPWVDRSRCSIGNPLAKQPVHHGADLSGNCRQMPSAGTRVRKSECPLLGNLASLAEGRLLGQKPSYGCLKLLPQSGRPGV